MPKFKSINGNWVPVGKTMEEVKRVKPAVVKELFENRERMLKKDKKKKKIKKKNLKKALVYGDKQQYQGEPAIYNEDIIKSKGTKKEKEMLKRVKGDTDKPSKIRRKAV